MFSKPTRLAVIGVIVGLCLDQIGSNLLWLVATFFRATYLTILGYSRDEIMEIMMQIDINTTYAYAVMSIGCLISVASGYVCANIAKRTDYKVALIFAFLDTLSALAISYPLNPDFFAVEHIVRSSMLAAATFAAALLGATFAINMLKKTNMANAEDW